ncbi:MAG: hypothetical protein QM644_17220 [Mobilitalea sp.]
MKLILTLLLITSGFASADYQKSLGFSPDKAYEIIVKGENEQDEEGLVYIRDAKTETLERTSLTCLQKSIASTKWEVIWKGDSVFAVTCDGAKAQQGYAVYRFNKNQWQEIFITGNYLDNILGRQGVTEYQKARVSFGAFEGETQYTIFCYCEPNPAQAEEAKKITTWKPSSAMEWVVIYDYSRGHIVEIKPLDMAGK